MKKILIRLRNVIVLTRFRMARGYIFLQSFTFAFIGAGVLKPYIPQVNIIVLGLIGMTIFYIAGYSEVRFGFLRKENQIATEQNPVIMEMKGKIK